MRCVALLHEDKMATRAEIRDAVTAEMKSISGTYDVHDANGSVEGSVTLSADSIGLRNPEAQEAENMPMVVYHEDYRKVVYNGVGAGPDMVVRDENGDVVEEQWREYIEAQFIIDVRASGESEKEPLYEALRSHLGQFQYSPWQSELHPDVLNVEVMDSQTADSGDVESVIRGDQLEVRVTFYRAYPYNTDNIESVDSLMDADADDTIDDTYTTN